MQCACGATEVQTLLIDENNHVNVVTDTAVESTCYSTGLTEGSHCGDCGDVIIAQTETEKKDHTLGAAVQEDVKDSTCYAKGSYNEVVYCSVEKCKAKISSTPKTIEMKAHTHGEIVIENKVAENCGKAGSYDKVVYCSVCEAANIKKELSREKVVVPATGNHTYSNFAHDDGKSTHSKICSVCNNVVTENCTESNWIIDVVATCMEKGSQYKKCTVCNYEMAREDINTIDHNFGDTAVNKESGKHHYQCQNILRTDAQCSEYGNEEECSGGTATCTAKAVCTKCNTEYGSELGHKDTDKNHICDNGCGEVQGTCADSSTDDNHVCDYGCGAVLEECVDGDDNNHNCDICDKENISKHEWVDATCDEPKTCTICNMTDGEKLGHDYDMTNTEDNLTRPVKDEDGTWKDGYYTYTCKNDENHTTTETVVRAVYTSYEAALSNLEKLLSTDITEDAKQAINTVISQNIVPENLITSEQKIIDDATKELILALETYGDELNIYTVTFKIDGSADVVVTVISGEAAEAPENPYKKYDDDYHYNFNGWDADFSKVTSDLTVNAEFVSVAHSYNTHTDKDDTYHTDACACGHTIDVVHTEESAVTTKATCEADGVRTYTCTLCGGTHTEPIAKREHVYKDNGEVKAATCIEEGVMNTICTNDATETHEACRHESTRVIPVDATNHKGYNEEVSRIASTCKVAGSVTMQCACGATEVQTLLIDENNHVNVVTDTAVESTCYSTGLTEGSHCGDCGDVIIAQTETEKKDHTLGAAVQEDVKDSTCYAKGSYNEVVYCSVEKCKAKISSTPKTIEMKAHTHGEIVIENKVAENCGKAGSYDKVVYCSVCEAANIKKELSREKVVVPATGNHTYSNFAHDDGKSTHSKICSVCNNVVTENCTESNWIIDVVATCMEKGSQYKKCTVCNYEMAREDINTIDHNFGDTAVNKESGKHHYQCQNILRTDAQCSEYGNEEECSGGTATCTAKAVCTKCNTEYGSELGHKDTDKNHICDNGCGEVQGTHADSDKNHVCDYGCKEAIGAHEDSNTDDNHVCDYCGKDAGEVCSDVAGDGDHKCDVCGKEEITEHVYGNASCNAPATCTECNETTGSELGHDFVYSSTVEHTCKTDGYDIYDCSRCDATENRNIQVAAHTIVQVAAKAPTCKDIGWNAYEYCTACNDYTTYAELPVGDHSYTSKITTPATCTKDGEMTYTCSGCGNSYTEVIASNGAHTVGERKYNAATCTSVGNSYAICADCGTKYDERVHEALGHNYSAASEFAITVEATCDQDGAIYRVCTRCGEREGVVYRTLLAKGHYYFVYGDAVAATCETPGMTQSKSCLNCGIRVEAEVIPALGHKANKYGQCERCDSLMSEDGNVCTCMCHKTSFFGKLIYKIVNFFWKLFKIKPVCDCGATHY